MAHVKSEIFDSPGGIYPAKMAFPFDLSYNHSTVELVEAATQENGFSFESKGFPNVVPIMGWDCSRWDRGWWDP